MYLTNSLYPKHYQLLLTPDNHTAAPSLAFVGFSKRGSEPTRPG